MLAETTSTWGLNPMTPLRCLFRKERSGRLSNYDDILEVRIFRKEDYKEQTTWNNGETIFVIQSRVKMDIFSPILLAYFLFEKIKPE